MQTTQMSTWIAFCIFILCMLFLDLFIHGRKPHSIGIKEAIGWSIFWISLALGFNAILFYTHGSQSAIEFFTGYLIEKSLSVDNLFVFLLIFKYFKTPEQHLHRILFYGILGAIVMRAVFIFGGIFLVQEFRWLLYILGLFLVYIGLKMTFQKESEIHPEQNPLLNFVKKWVRVTHEYKNDNFFVKLGGKYYATPLFSALLAVEFSDLVFAIDSIPAIFAITLDPFIVFTSNIFAILGLRALFFALKASLEFFHYLHYALGIILTFIGMKMLIAPWIHLPIIVTLGFIGSSLAIAIILSVLFPKDNKH
ncbi:MAG: TerC family protein [Parachlamydiaceae bacterium]|nr:TerC family protein [Parachlamydiaceae bacterium]